MVRSAHPKNFSSANTLKSPKVPKGSRKSHSFKDNLKPSESKNAARERCRVENLRNAFTSLQQCLPSVPPNTKLSKLDVLILATTYISHLSRILSEDSALTDNGLGILSSDFDLFDGTLVTPPLPEVKNPNWEKSYLHPVRKWPMRSRLYAGVEESESGCSDYGLPSVSFHKTLWS